MTRTCTDCDNPIPEKRLRAVPSATRCTSCQEVVDGETAPHSVRPFERLGSAGKFATDDLVPQRRRPLVTFGIANAI